MERESDHRHDRRGAGQAAAREHSLRDDDDVLDEGWTSPRMYLMVGKPRSVRTFPDAIY